MVGLAAVCLMQIFEGLETLHKIYERKIAATLRKEGNKITAT